VVVGDIDIHAEIRRAICSVRDAENVIDLYYELSAQIYELVVRARR